MSSDTLRDQRVDPASGLSDAEVEKRRRAHGFNEVPEPVHHPLLDFLKRFWGLSPWMLELIMLLSAVLRKYSDLIVVGALLFINAALGFLQERRAASAVEALRQRLRVNARVLRNAIWNVVPARELVPGDIVRVRTGDVVPADVEILLGTVSADQSALTGETAEVKKGGSDVLASGSLLRHGEATGVVVATGIHTQFGRTTELVASAKPQLHIEEVVSDLVRRLFMIVGTLLAIVAVLAMFRGLPLVDMLPLLLVLLLSAVPVALPVMFTVSMAVGATELARRGVLVTRLSAAEDAATMDVLCVDKTGTITLNQLAVTGVTTFGAQSEADVLTAGAWASQEANQDPIDLAFLKAARERHLIDPSDRNLEFSPFDAATRRTEALIEHHGERFRAIKGAVRAIAQRCGLREDEVATLEQRVTAAALNGFRTLAVARGPEIGTPQLLGLVTLYDPPRPEAPKLIAALRALGISVKMLTGDALAVAGEIAREVGLSRIVRVAEIKEAAGTGGVTDRLSAADGFAEVYPEDKFIVVQALQRAGHVVGMTGDGVNDAPALRQAEVGIAVVTATDVAKGAASVVLNDPGLTNIVALVEQGRIIYQRVLTWIINKLSRTVLKSAFVAIAFVFTGKFVISAFGMLLLVFMTDFAKIALATDQVRGSRKPESWKIGGLVSVSIALGGLMVGEMLGLLALGWARFGLATHEAALSTFSFQALLYFAVFSILSSRERRHFWSSMPSKTLTAALLADVVIGTALASLGLPGLAPLPWWQTGIEFVYAAFACLVVNDAAKVAMLRRIGYASDND